MTGENVGTLDRTLRLVIGIALLCVPILMEGPERWLALLGVVLLATAAIGVCPTYRLFGVTSVLAPPRGRARA